ncbi:hypothetical protein BH23CHL2_BH23CHL2_07790 [soil metagenome]
MVPTQSSQPTSNNSLLQPTYQNRLRVIGYHLDTEHFREAAILEIEGGFIVRAQAKKGKRAEALEFPDSQFVQLMQGAIDDRGHGAGYDHHSSVLPTGYQDFFRALGFLLDNQAAIGVTIVELESHFLVAGLEPSNSIAGHNAFRRFERYLTRDNIQQLLDDAFNRRNETRKRGGLFGIF